MERTVLDAEDIASILRRFKVEISLRQYEYSSHLQHKVYVLRSPNGKLYFGMSSETDIEARWGHGGRYKRGTYIRNAIDKYGWDEFLHLVIYSFETQEECLKVERMLILKYNTTDRTKGYNMTSGGEHPVFGSEARKRISQRAKTRYQKKEERQKISNGLKNFYNNLSDIEYEEYMENMIEKRRSIGHSVIELDEEFRPVSRYTSLNEAGRQKSGGSNVAGYGKNIKRSIDQPHTQAYGAHWILEQDLHTLTEERRLELIEQRKESLRKKSLMCIAMNKRRAEKKGHI